MNTLLIIGAALFLVLPYMALAVDCPIPDTWQTICYAFFGSEIPCPQPGEPFYGQDANYAPCNPHSYTKLDANGNDLPESATEWVMVRDNVTELIWEVKTDDGSIHDKDNTYNWQDAQDVFIATLNSNNFGGHSDWRLPTIKELSTLVDSSIGYPGPTIDTTYFPNTVSSYWSSTTYAKDPSLAWYVHITSGSVFDYDKSDGFYVRAVRSGQCGSLGNFIDNGDGTVTDTDTGLMWEVKTDDGGLRDWDKTYIWEQALSYCENLILAGYNDWRLPNRNELQSIVDYNHYNLSIDPIFSYTKTHRYWSSTTVATYPYAYAWYVYFYVGSVSLSSKTSGAYVRAVRSGPCVADADEDGINNRLDNCPFHYNSGQEDTDGDGLGDVCDNCPNTSNTVQEDTYPPQGNGIGDACDCEGNFNCSTDQDVDGSDAALFKADFGRSAILGPCNNESPCNGDFNCDRDCDGTDAALFKADFGRSSMQNPCPACNTGVVWCTYQ